MLCDSFFNSCFAFRASLDLPLRSMDSNFHPLFDRSWTQIAGYFHQKISEILERLLYHNSLPSIQPVCTLLSFTSWLLPNLAQCSNSITQTAHAQQSLPIPKLSASFLSYWKAENLTTCSQLISLEQAKLLRLRHAAIVARNSQCTSVQTNCTPVKWRHLPFYLENLCGSATEYFGHTEKQQKKNLTKPFHMDLLSGFGVTLIRRQADLPICGFTASFIRSDIDLTFSKNTCVPVCPAWSAAISSPGIPNNQQNTSTSIWIDTNTTAKHVNLALRFGFQQWPSLVDFYNCHFPSLEMFFQCYLCLQNSPGIGKYLLYTSVHCTGYFKKRY